MEQLDIPEWLTAEFLKTCLQSDEGSAQDVVVTSHSIEHALPPGSNYGSNMLRVKVEYKSLDDESKENSLSLIIKAPAASEFIKNMGIDHVYKLEKRFYSKFITETYKFCRHDVVAKQYTSPNPLSLVLEDLRASGYKMVDRYTMLDFDHCQLYIKASARLHALSMAVFKTNPASIESLFEDCPNFAGNFWNLMKIFQKRSMQCMATFLEDKPEYTDFSSVFREASKNDLMDEILEEIHQRKYSLLALATMDPWCANMMFKYNSSGEVESIKILDFQALNFSSPVRQLVTFLWVSPQPEVRKQNLNKFYRLYCDTLNANLEEFGCPERLSFEELREEIIFMVPLAIGMFCFTSLLCLGDEAVDFNQLYFTDANFQKSIKETKLYKLCEGSSFNKHYPQVLDEMAKLGFVEYFRERIMQHRSKH